VHGLRQLARRRGILTLIATMTETNRDDLEATQPRASDVEHEGGPYRDDLHAAQARVSDLEREAEQLRKRNAELHTPENTQPLEVGKAPEPDGATRFMVSATKACLAIGFVAVCGPTHQHVPYTPHWGWAGICFGLAFLFWFGSGFQRLWR
jgi:chromosome segregation ATPase